MIYVMSDIHGNKKAFDSMLKKINFSDSDELFILGDIVDRNPYGIELLQRIIKMENVHMLLGNHEYMMMDALGFPYEPEGCTAGLPNYELKKQWFMNGGRITFQAWNKLSSEEKKEIKKYLNDLPLKYDLEVNGKNFKLVHAVPCELYDALEDQLMGESRAYFSVWERELIHVFSEIDNFITIFGHTPTCNLTGKVPMEIYHKGNIIGIDCGAAYQFSDVEGGRLACIRLDDMKEFYVD